MISAGRRCVPSSSVPVKALKTREGYDLQLMSWGDGSSVPTSGQRLVVFGLDPGGLLHIRTFDNAGGRTDTYETMEGGRGTSSAMWSARTMVYPGLLLAFAWCGAGAAADGPAISPLQAE